MKDYLKMADAFPAARVGNEPVKPWVNGDYYVFYEMQAEYAAHAINSHDELVQMNKELLAALENVWGLTEFVYDGINMSACEKHAVKATISKVKGGAA